MTWKRVQIERARLRADDGAARQVRGGAYWLLLAYHGRGNLRDFLAANVLDWKRLLTMASGLARGLAHLHSDTLWPPGAPKVTSSARPFPSRTQKVRRADRHGRPAWNEGVARCLLLA